MSSMKAQFEATVLGGANSPYLEELYESYLKDPNSVDETWRDYFAALPMVADNARDVPHSEYRTLFKDLTKNRRNGVGSSPASSSGSAHELKQINVTQLINSYRVRGHQLAKIDPLGGSTSASVREIRLHENGLSEADLDTMFQTPALEGIDRATLRDIVAHLDRCYCGSIGYEFMYVDHTPQKDWLQQRIESVASAPVLGAETQRWLLQRVTAAESLERHLGSRYAGQKRFSLEGGESLIVVMSELVKRAGAAGAKDMVIGMAHRGRLNVLVNILGKNPAQLFSEFEGKKRDQSLSSGDVKYHQGFSSDLKTAKGNMHLALAFNPSHLEIVSPVVEGSVRSRQDRYGDKDGDWVIPINIHGDAAFAGQGVVMETFAMADSRGFSTKGTVHIICNNQIGFTTSNAEDARSTLYASDVAKVIGAPIFHVNGDDPEAVLFATQLAFDFRMTFKKDVVIDLVCYRRHGHNETDEPSVTQPLMYKTIKSLPTTRKLYANRLVEQGVITDAQANSMVDDYRQQLDDGESVAPDVLIGVNEAPELQVDWSQYMGKEWRAGYDAKVPLASLQALAGQLTTIPEEFRLHSRVQKIIDDRRKMTAGGLAVDWGFAETLAYATLVNQGYSVRLTGQDSGRGTFAHRHAVLHNQNKRGAYVPLRELSGTNNDIGSFLVIDSLLSEEAVLAFEYGYATADPNTLVVWEAQFGDFANGAQVVIDQFISSGETKWGRLCGITMLLPHGYEGQGPEHSSARIERFLQLCAEDNMQVLVPSTPAQAYHMLRRQMIRPMRRPLIVMSPKSLLRHRLATSTLEELADGKFEPVLNEIDDNIEAAKVKRLVFCSGKVYYDLLEARREANITDVALVRLEQLYPFPYDEMLATVQQFGDATEIVWCQEEPRNQGAWRSNRHRIERVLPEGTEVEFAGRAPSASPAAGYNSDHIAQQKQLVQEALGLVPNSLSQ